MLRAPFSIVALVAALGVLPARNPSTTGGPILDGGSFERISKPATIDPLDAWLERLVQVESGGRSNVTVLDRNGHISRGCLQFQDRTLIAQARRHGFLPHSEDSELPSIAYDCHEAKNLARAMLRNNPANWKHWRNSVQQIGLPPLVE